MLPVQMINSTNERRLAKGHETTPLRNTAPDYSPMDRYSAVVEQQEHPLNMRKYTRILFRAQKKKPDKKQGRNKGNYKDDKDNDENKDFLLTTTDVYIDDYRLTLRSNLLALSNDATGFHVVHDSCWTLGDESDLRFTFSRTADVWSLLGYSSARSFFSAEDLQPEHLSRVRSLINPFLTLTR
ncbi:hypothetical protein TNCV_770071 [Trichonephila clavipes]|nr:hypothetical protein TNCV_770071 [Trichonephila clavipes]